MLLSFDKKAVIPFDAIKNQFLTGIKQPTDVKKHKDAFDITDAPELAYHTPGRNDPNINSTAGYSSENVAIAVNKQLQPSEGANVVKPEITVTHLADEVYRIIESKLRIEKERRGIFR